MQPFCPHSAAGMYDGRAAGSALHHSNQPALGKRPLVPWKLCMARPSCFRLLAQLTRLDDSRTFCTAGTSSDISTAMMAMTTSSSTRVKPRREVEDRALMETPVMKE